MPYPAIQPTVPTTAPLTSEMKNMALDTNAAMTIRDKSTGRKYRGVLGRLLIVPGTKPNKPRLPPSERTISRPEGNSRVNVSFQTHGIHQDKIFPAGYEIAKTRSIQRSRLNVIQTET